MISTNSKDGTVTFIDVAKSPVSWEQFMIPAEVMLNGKDRLRPVRRWDGMARRRAARPCGSGSRKDRHR